MTVERKGEAALVAKLRSLRENYDRASFALDAEFKARRGMLKDPIREAVREGLELGMPQRRIYHDGLSMGQVSQLYAFLGMPAASNAEKLKEHLTGVAVANVEANVGDTPRTITVLSDTEFALITSDGRRVTIPYKRSAHLANVSGEGLTEDELDIIAEQRPAWSVLDKAGNLMWEPEKDMEAFMAYQENRGALIK